MNQIQQLLPAQGAIRKYCLVMVVIAAVSSLANAKSANDLATEAQNPGPVNTFEIDGGYNLNFRSGNESDSYYRITYRSSLVKSEGTPFKYASSLDLAAPALTTGRGDRNKLLLRFEQGTTTIGDGLFEANGVAPLTLRGIEALNLRGTALIAGDADGKTFQFAAGLESPPLRIPGLQNTQFSNWIVFGINAQRQEATDSDNDDKNVGLLTYRAFLGKAFGWRKSADVDKTAAKIEDEFLKQAPTYEEAKILAEKINSIEANNRTSLQQLFVDAVIEAESEANWQRTVKEMAYGTADAVTDQPTFALYAENSGWYSFSDSFNGKRLRNLLTLTLDYWPLLNYDHVFLRLRYENGHERAAPTDRKNHLLASINLRF